MICNYKIALQLAKNGEYIVSYQQKKSKRVVLNFVFRKIGLIARIYGDNLSKHGCLLESFPDKLVNAIDKSAVCRADVLKVIHL